MLKIFAEGLLIIYIAFCILFLVAGNMYTFWVWVKDFDKRKRIGAQYFYLKFWGYPVEYSEKEMEKLKLILEQFEKEHDGTC